MKGAEYADLFKTGQYGRFYITSSSHARGKTFEIQILPKGELAIPNGNTNPCLNDNAVKVYGMISGHLGWTEVYGWIHEGKWQEDFYKMVTHYKNEKAKKNKKEIDETKNRENLKLQKKLDLLSTY